MSDIAGRTIWPGTWLSDPAEWSVDAQGALHAVSGDRTDFWQDTYYGFRRDDGHALLRPVDIPFTATLRFDGEFKSLYDQAGLMLRADANEWIKFGIEHTDGAPKLSVVATFGGRSDWSAQPIHCDGPVSLRATSLGNGILLQWSADGGASFAMARLAPTPQGHEGASSDAASTLRIGPYLCSPERAGFRARFHSFEVGPPAIKGLHQ